MAEPQSGPSAFTERRAANADDVSVWDCAIGSMRTMDVGEVPVEEHAELDADPESPSVGSMAVSVDVVEVRIRERCGVASSSLVVSVREWVGERCCANLRSRCSSRTRLVRTIFWNMNDL